jgi:predicted PurR-regulated permease PerM
MAPNSQRLISRPLFYTLIGIFLVGLLFYFLRGILAPVMLAFLLAYAFDPLVEWLTRHRFPRALASAVCLLLLILLAAGLLALILPALQQELRSLAQKMPAYLEKIRDSAVPWIEETFGVELPDTINEALESARQQIAGRAGEFAGPVASFLKGVLSSTLSLLASLIYVIIIPLFTFYFLNDYPKITGWFKDLVPFRHRDKTDEILTEVDGVLAGFIRGQLTICAILAILYSILLSVVGVPAGITIGIIAGLFNLVPYLGTATGLLLSCLFLLLEGSAWTGYLAVGLIFVGVSTADGLFLTPRILGKKLGLAPVAVILAVLAFGEVFGFLGVLIAVPVTAIGKVLGKRALDYYKKSRAFKGSGKAHEEDQARPQ